MQRPVSALFPSRCLVWLMLGVVMLVAGPAFAVDANVERQARTLQRKAIEEDSLNLAYPEAIRKLATAISKCGEEKCTRGLKGALYRDLGAVLILSGSVDEGRAAFLKALSYDPALELDPAYKTPMLEQVWLDARRKSGAGGGEGAGAAPSGGGAEPGGGQPATGDFAHMPAGSQLVRTPLPVYAEYIGNEKLVRVVVKYKGAGMGDWKTVELRKLDNGYGGLIPCKDVGAGVMQYYIQGYGTSDDPVAAAGSRTKPFSVPIKQAISGPSPSLPGQEPPKQCADTAGSSDCPPDFPGCHAVKKPSGEECDRNSDCESGACSGGRCVEKKGEGEDCEKDNECSSGACSDGRCTAPKKGSGESCDSDDDCNSDSCKDGKCSGGQATRKFGKTPRIWIGVNLQLDLTLLPGANDVCILNGNNPPGPTTSYECVDPNGKNFPGTSASANANIRKGIGDSVAGGFAFGNFRIMASIDYALTMNMLVGARAGYVLFTDPASSPGGAFAPIHLEGRFTYLFGQEGLAASLAPMAFAALGATESDASFGVQVVNNGSNQPLNENAWTVAGPIFFAIGGGARFLLSDNLAATAALKFQAAFGGTAGFLPSLAPEVGMQLGL